MATVLVNRSDLWPVGTVVGIYPGGSDIADGSAPTGAAVASATVASDGSLTVTDAGLSSYRVYVAAAQVGGVWRKARVRSTLDVADHGDATGTFTTVSGSTAVTSVSVSTGALAVGQRIVSPNLPAGTYVAGGSGISWTLTSPATASGSSVAFEAHGATVPRQGTGATLVPTDTTRWRAVVMQRRSLIGTS